MKLSLPKNKEKDVKANNKVTNVIEFINLSKYYGNTCGIDKLNLKITKGQIFGFLGPNGAGKTTSIRCLLGILRPSNGFVKIFGQKIESVIIHR